MPLVARRRVSHESRKKAFAHAKRAPGLRAARYFVHELRRAMRQAWRPVCALRNRQVAAAGEFVGKPLFACRGTRKDANTRDLDLPHFLRTTKRQKAQKQRRRNDDVDAATALARPADGAPAEGGGGQMKAARRKGQADRGIF
ncbi:hypothetical protein A7C99_4284 [Trichophyton rubrum]|uniref:Uncharacterized protein n=1 Tax=Trichophyton rubrum TaxID=5551 RepID=A0A178EY52_TRIRU|nr:hypothetical protein HL42_3821 [Trichophyton rubrum]OAL64848.1 hypothetical protein A7C99_4284 [Trichophyton rubrum]